LLNFFPISPCLSCSSLLARCILSGHHHQLIVVFGGQAEDDVAIDVFGFIALPFLASGALVKIIMLTTNTRWN
jgi:hypothetical protein